MLPPRPEALIQRKIVLLGESRVGKTSLIARKAHEAGETTPTTGCHCTELPFLVDGKQARLEVWDTAGQETYRALVPVYLRGAHCAVILFDVADADSFASLSHWYKMLDDVIEQPIPVFLVANKIDISDEAVVNHEEAAKFATEHRSKFAKTSARNGDGVDELFNRIIFELSQSNLSDQVETPGVVVDESRKCPC
jgi:small GTP-binding protein